MFVYVILGTFLRFIKMQLVKLEITLISSSLGFILRNSDKFGGCAGKANSLSNKNTLLHHELFQTFNSYDDSFKFASLSIKQINKKMGNVFSFMVI